MKTSILNLELQLQIGLKHSSNFRPDIRRNRLRGNYLIVHVLGDLEVMSTSPSVWLLFCLAFVSFTFILYVY